MSALNRVKHTTIGLQAQIQSLRALVAYNV